MICQTFQLPKYNWTVYAYYVVTAPHAEEILKTLVGIGCDGSTLDRAYVNLTSGSLDTGLTYSNIGSMESIVVFAKTSSAKEFMQSYKHETGHLQSHIAQAYGLNPHGEEIQYIGDDIVAATWEVAKDLLCDCCRGK